LIDDLQLARTVSETVLATEGVYSLGVGRYAEAATYGAGEKVTGVVVNRDAIRMHIVARYPLADPIPVLAERIRDRVAPEAQGKTLTVVVEDLEVARDVGL
jgi:hypothetical protein